MAKDQRRAGRQPRGAAAPAVAADAAISPELRDQRLYQAVVAYQAGQYGAAEAEARQLREAAPHFFPAVLLLGMVAGKTGRADEGIELLREAIALDRRSVEARSELAGLLRAEGRHDEAVAEAKHAVRLRPVDPGSHNNLGLCYLAAGRVPLAITHFKRAIELNRDAPMFHHNLGLALYRQSRNQEAISAFRHALSLDATNPETLAHLGQLLFQHGQPDEAAKFYERAAALQGDATLASVHKAEALIQRGHAAEAEDCLRSALIADPRSDLGYQVLGVLLQRRGRFDEAVEALERAIELQPRRVSSYVSLSLGKKFGTADDWLVQGMRALVDDPGLTPHERSRLHFALGKANEDLGDYANAIRHFDRAHEIEAAQMRQAGRSFDRRDHKAGVDRLIAGFTADFFARFAEFGSTDERSVLIVGMPRSGTTLVEQILSSHPEIGGAGELSFWTDRQGLAVALLAGSLPPAEARRAAEEYLALLRTIAPAPLRVTDKMPANFLVLGLVHMALPNARIIHCRRDPIDVCLSIWSTPFGNPIDFAHDRADLVFYYQHYERLMAHWREVIPPHRLLEIDYEALVAEPDRVTREMIDFCGLEWDDACLRHEQNEHVIMTPSLWQARQPVYRDSVARWRRYENWLGDFRRLARGEPN